MNNSEDINGLAGTWSGLTAEEELGYVYIPVEAPSSAAFGGNRSGNNLFGNSMLGGKCPRFVQLKYHNHGTEYSHFNTTDDYLGKEILDWLSEGFAGTRKGTVSQ